MARPIPCATTVKLRDGQRHTETVRVCDRKMRESEWPDSCKQPGCSGSDRQNSALPVSHGTLAHVVQIRIKLHVCSWTDVDYPECSQI